MIENAFIEFSDTPPPPDIKTRRVDVINRRSGAVLGEIRWYAGWRQYTFHPRPNTIFNITCMADISDYIRQMMAERKG